MYIYIYIFYIYIYIYNKKNYEHINTDTYMYIYTYVERVATLPASVGDVVVELGEDLADAVALREAAHRCWIVCQTVPDT